MISLDEALSSEEVPDPENFLSCLDGILCLNKLLTTKDKNGKTALYYAREKNYQDIVKLLELYDED